MKLTIHRSDKNVSNLSDERAIFGINSPDSRTPAEVKAWFRYANLYYSNFAPTVDDLISGNQRVFYVPPFTEFEEAAIAAAWSPSCSGGGS